MAEQSRGRSAAIDEVINLVIPMAKWKLLQPLDFVSGATEQYDFVSLRLGTSGCVLDGSPRISLV